ncbi:MAG: transposase [Proteobacteria bacterium]|nr:transposase [Pseudomonadota bacterium]MBU4010181.1 transposase [Pseudomonadota bacterium]
MRYDPDTHHRRRSVRLTGYDYSKAGLYFITICTNNRLCVLGQIVGAGSKPAQYKTPEATTETGSKPAPNNIPAYMVLNDYGRIVEQIWFDLVNHVKNFRFHEFVAMPNHIHGIIEIIDDECLMNRPTGLDSKRAGLEPAPTVTVTNAGVEKRTTISEIVRQLKTFSARRINKLQNTPGVSFWQRNYYEHIIRDEKSYCKISEYIRTNPLQWQSDKYYEPIAKRPIGADLSVG